VERPRKLLARLHATRSRQDPQAPPKPAGVEEGGSQCDLCADNWLFVLAAGGRTGSTSALSMFSRVPEFELMGEHRGFLLTQMNAMKELEKAMAFWTTEPESAPSWKHSDVDMHSVYCNVQDLVRRVLFGSDYGRPSPTVLGFKEIRYTDVWMLPFLGTVFPCARFVFTLRERPLTNKTLEAAPWVQYEPYEQKAEFVKAVHSIFSNTTALLPVESLTVDTYNNILQGMLGVRGCRFSSIIHDNANGRYKADNTTDVIEGTCNLSQVDFRLDEHTLRRHAALWAALHESGKFRDV